MIHAVKIKTLRRVPGVAVLLEVITIYFVLVPKSVTNGYSSH